MRSIMAAGLTVLALSASAEMQPGLWEHRVSMESETGRLERMLEQLHQQLEAVPEQHRQRMKEAMAKRGVSLDFANQTYRACVTAEEAERGEFDWSEETDCEHRVIEEGEGGRVEFECPSIDASGEITFDGGTAYSGRSTATLDLSGEPEQVTITHSGERVSPDCP